MRQYQIVSGWTRGGTSALMVALKQAGVPILGMKYPYSFTMTREKGGKPRKWDGGFLVSTSRNQGQNPTGFWEVSSICTERGLQEGQMIYGFDGDLVKVPLDVLRVSEPKFIRSAILILRKPNDIMVSHIRIKSQNEKLEKKDWGLFIKVASLGFLAQLVAGVKFLEENSIPFFITTYEKLLDDTEKELDIICKFLDREQLPANIKKASSIIDKNLNKGYSLDKEYQCQELDDLTQVYSKVSQGKFGSLYLDYSIEKIKGRIKELDEGKGLTKGFY